MKDIAYHIISFLLGAIVAVLILGIIDWIKAAG